METQGPPPKRRSPIGWLALFAVLLADAGLALWLWPNHRKPDHYNASGFNLAEAPPPEAEPATVKAEARLPAANSIPPAPSARPPAPASFPARAAVRPEWSQAASSFARLAGRSRYRRSPVLRAWTRDFMAYPDLNVLGRKYQKDRDLLFFAVGVLRSTNFAKMLRKYGASPDVKDFFMDLMSAPGVSVSSQALFRDRNVMNSIKDLTIPGLPPLGALMAAGAQGPAPAADNAALRRFLQDRQQGPQ